MSTIFMNHCFQIILILLLFVGKGVAVAQHATALEKNIFLAKATYVKMKSEDSHPLFSIKVGGKLALCSHTERGEILLDVQGGNPPYTFLWNNLSTEQNRYNLNAGTYTVVITDRTGQSHTERIVVQPPFPLIAELVHTQPPSCPNANDGSAAVKIKVGRGEPYKVEWSHGLQDALEATGLQAGTYEVKIFDKFNCYTTVAFALVAAAEPVSIEEEVLEPSCGKQNGSIALTVGGANPPYTFRWSNGATSATLADLGPGQYTVEVTDKNKCVWTKSFALAADSPMKISLLEQKQPTCKDNNDGVIEVAISGGVPPYNFDWDNKGSGSRVEGLGAGMVKLKVTDGAGCEVLANYLLEAAASPSVSIQTQIDMDCVSGEAKGSVWVTIQGGVPPYQIRWNNGMVGKSEIEFSNLSEVQVEVTDALGCTSISNQKINIPTNSQLKQLEVEITKLHAGSDKTIQVDEAIFFNSNEGRQFIAWEWDFGDGTKSNEESPAHRYASPGTYTVVLKAFDMAACMETSSLEVKVVEKTEWVVMPNAFSPNGDGLNDFFQPVLFNVTQFAMDIFNQWGEHLYADSGLEIKGWDGFYKGTLSPKGNYVYKISFTTNTGEHLQKSGYVALIR